MNAALLAMPGALARLSTAPAFQRRAEPFFSKYPDVSIQNANPEAALHEFPHDEVAFRHDGKIALCEVQAERVEGRSRTIHLIMKAVSKKYILHLFIYIFNKHIQNTLISLTPPTIDSITAIVVDY